MKNPGDHLRAGLRQESDGGRLFTRNRSNAHEEPIGSNYSFSEIRFRKAIDFRMTSNSPKSSPRAKAGVRSFRKGLDSCLRRNDGERIDGEHLPWERRHR